MRLHIASQSLGPEQAASLTRELLGEIRANVDSHASLGKSTGERGSKGDLVTLGEIVLAAVTGGTVSKLIEVIFSFLSRNRKFSVEMENDKGKKLKLNFDYVNRSGHDKALELVANFVQKN